MAAASRRVVVSRFGGPEVLEVVEAPVPEPRAGEARVAVRACGVAFGDRLRREGVLVARPGFTPGYDVVGVVDAVGHGADQALAGRRVAAFLPVPGIGGYAAHVVVPAGRLVPVPDGVDDASAVALGLDYVTAWQVLVRLLDLRAGSTVLVQGAAGGVGTAALDVARHLGVHAIGTASPRKHEHVRGYGAVPVDYEDDVVARVEALVPGGVHAALDPIGGASLDRSYATLRPGGTLVGFGSVGEAGWTGLVRMGWTLARLRLRLRDTRRVRTYAFGTPGVARPEHCAADWATVLALAAEGALSPCVAARVPLEEAAAAHAAWGQRPGKTVLIVG